MADDVGTVAEATQAAPGTDAPEATPDPAYLQAEMKKIISQRERAKAEVARLKEQSTLAETERVELEALRKAQADAEEKRKLEAGDYESAKAAILKEKEAAEQRAQAAADRYANKAVESAFAAATDLFGPTGITTLTPEFAFAGLRSHVEFVPGEGDAPDRMVVRDLAGEIIPGQDGNPATFAEGMRHLIDQWPSKEHILRGAARAGSGSTGGSGETVSALDRAELAERANRGDPAALKALRDSQPKQRMVMGAHWDKPAG